MIYIATNIHGRGVEYVMGFENKQAYYLYACEVTSMSDKHPRQSMTIDDLCEELVDRGPGMGSRSHRRGRDAIAYLRDDAENIDCWNLPASVGGAA